MNQCAIHTNGDYNHENTVFLSAIARNFSLSSSRNFSLINDVGQFCSYGSN